MYDNTPPLKIHQLMVLDFLKENPNSSKKQIKSFIKIREDFEMDFDILIKDLLSLNYIKQELMNSRKVYTLI